MSRVKMMGILAVMVMVMVLALGTSGALASTINFDGTHNFYVTVQNETTLGYVAPNAGTGNITAATTDYASTNPDEGGATKTGPTTIANVSTTYTATATLSTIGTTWLKDRTDTTYYAGNTLGVGQYGGTISRNFTSEGPEPFDNSDVNYNGQVGQVNTKASPNPGTQLLHLVFTAPSDAYYAITFSDTYSSTASVNQGTGSDFPVTWFSGYAQLIYKITDAAGNYSDNGSVLYNKSYGTFDSTTPIGSFTDSSNRTIGNNQEYYLLAGQTLTFDISLYAYYDAETTLVPAPSTMLLLGSGLMGLGLLRRKWSFKK